MDVEEAFQVSALEPYVPRATWDHLPSRVEQNTARLLELLAEFNTTATFFTLGWIAQRHSRLVREIASAGHELASHGWGHEKITRLDHSGFRASVRDTKAILEDISGGAVQGYRAPSFSIVRGCEWALDVLIEEGYTYDSSLFPVRRRGYGFASGKRDRHIIERSIGTLIELPPATLELAGRVMPAGGGAYFRLLPPSLVFLALRSAERRGASATFYIHPWELDPEQQQFPVSSLTRIRHYGKLSRTLPRLRELLSKFEFSSIRDSLNSDASAPHSAIAGSELAAKQ